MHSRRSMFTTEDALTHGPSPAFGRGEIEKGLSLAERVHPKYQPVFEKLDETGIVEIAKSDPLRYDDRHVHHSGHES